jgi:hypothetical protein
MDMVTAAFPSEALTEMLLPADAALTVSATALDTLPADAVTSGSPGGALMAAISAAATVALLSPPVPDSVWE